MRSDPPEFPSPEEALVGETIGHYRLDRILSSGGMGTVYVARQEQPQRDVAIKILKGGIVSREALRRFEVESQILAGLHHPSIAQVYEAGTWRPEEGTYGLPWFAMEYVPDALSITEYARERELSRRDRLRLVVQVCEAVEYGHERGVIHRDLKPPNLLVDDAGRVKVIDFGVARATDSESTAVETEAGQILGTMQYMSPEQCAGNPTTLDARTDVYSLGMVLYELLCGCRPYEIEGLSIYAAVQHVHEAMPPRPSTHDRALRGDLETIVLQALAKRPDERYASARALALDLERFLAGRPVEAKPRRLHYVLRMAIRRSPIRSALLALALLLAGTVAILGVYSARAGEETRVAEGETALEQALHRVFTAQFDEVEPFLARAEAAGVAPGRVRVLRGLAALRRGEVAAAIAGLEAARVDDPESLGLYALLLLASIEAGEFERALALTPPADPTPRWPEDRLAAGLALHAYWPERSLRWTEELAAEQPSAAVFYVLGLHRVSILMETYDSDDIEPALAAAATARNQMPHNLRAIWNHAAARMIAADLHQHRGDDSLHAFYLEQVKRDVAQMLTEHADEGDAHVAAAQLAIYEKRWSAARDHLVEAVRHPHLWPVARFYLPQVGARLGRNEEGLAALDAMPESFRFHPIWARDRAFLLAETEGPAAAGAALEEWLSRGRERNGASANPVIRDVPFQVYCLLGRHADAVAYGRAHLEESWLLAFGRPYLEAKDRYLCGRLDGDQLLAAASTRQDRIDARTLRALERLATGDRERALSELIAVEGEGLHLCDSRNLIPALWPAILLSRLRDDPTWPPWIE